MKNKSDKKSESLAKTITENIIRAHEVSGHVTMMEHTDKMRRAVQKCVCNDDRFCAASEAVKADLAAGRSVYKPTPYIPYDGILTAGDDGQHQAVIQTAAGKLVRHGFTYNKDDGTAKMMDGDSLETERNSTYATEIDRHEANMIAAQEVISCRATNGVKLTAAEKWNSGESVSFIYVPGGISTISAGFRKGESITCTVQVDEKTAEDLQESFDYVSATEKQEPYADEDHEGKKATLRFPGEKVKFVYGTLKGEEGIIVKGAEPTTYGAEAVNGKVYASWSPEFATDADYPKAKCKNKHWTFPDGVRGSASNPARMVAVNFVTGALTNKPAFKKMPNVKANLNEGLTDDEAKAETLKIVATLFKDDAEREAFAATKPEAGWLRAALLLPIEAEKPEEKKPEPEPGKKEIVIQASASELELQAMMNRRNSETAILSAMTARVPQAAHREGMDKLYARAGVNAK